MASRAPLLLVFAGWSAVASVGCSSTAEPPTVAIVDPGSDPGSGSSSEGSTAHPVRRNEDPRAKTSTGFRLSSATASNAAVFDGPCQNLRDEGAACGTQGRVAVEFSNHPLHAEPPCKLVSLSHAQEGSYGPEAASACVVGDEMIATEACVMCRMPDAGWAYHARISEMTDEQAKAAFERLRLQGAIPRTAEEWQAAIERGQAPLVMVH
ncbi:MAG: hypothetical protein U0414_26700 [Polyangiaceae bacterium]